MYVSDYTTIDAVVRQLDKADPLSRMTPAGAEYAEFYALCRDYVRQASAYVTAMTEQAFVPYKSSHPYYLRDLLATGQFRRGLLFLHEPLLVITQIEWIDTLLSATQFRAQPYGLPYSSIQFDMNQLRQYREFNDAITVSGWWGTHMTLEAMYQPVAVWSNITLNQSQVVVPDSSAYEVLSYLRLDDELVQVIGRVEQTHTLTLRRGVNGTSPAAYTTVTVQRYYPLPDIELATTRLAAYLYQRRSDLTGRVQMGDGSIVLDDMPVAVREIVKRYRRMGISPV